MPPHEFWGFRMLRWFFDWQQRRAERRQDIVMDARALLAEAPLTAYYDAQRLATRARVGGDRAGFTHWTRVAVEAARLGDGPMDMDVLRGVVEEEERDRASRPPSSHPR